MCTHSQAEEELVRDNGERRGFVCPRSCVGRWGGGVQGEGQSAQCDFNLGLLQFTGTQGGTGVRWPAMPPVPALPWDPLPPSAAPPAPGCPPQPSLKLTCASERGRTHPTPTRQLGALSAGAAAVCLHPDLPPPPPWRQRPDPLPGAHPFPAASS